MKNNLQEYKDTLDTIKSLGESLLTEDGLLDEKERAELEKEYNEFLSEESNIRQEIEAMQKRYEEIERQQKEDLEELSKKENLKEVIETLNGYIEKYEDTPELSNHYKGIVTQLMYTINLKPLFESIAKIKNPSKLVEASRKSFNDEMKKLTKKLRENRFTFYDPRVILDVLVKHMNEEEAKLFLYSFSRFINSQGKSYINTHSLFISQLIKNLTLLNKETFEYTQELVDNINKYNARIKG